MGLIKMSSSTIHILKSSLSIFAYTEFFSMSVLNMGFHNKRIFECFKSFFTFYRHMNMHSGYVQSNSQITTMMCLATSTLQLIFLLNLVYLGNVIH